MFYLIIFIFGAVFGSFFNVCISRIPKKESIVFPNSSCPNCKTKIKPYHNIPIISYILLKGKCAYCGSKIDIHYFLVELLTPVLLILLYAGQNEQISLVFFKYTIFISFGLIIFFIDLYHYIIPDKLSLPLIVLGLIFSFLPNTDIGWMSVGIGALSGFLLFLFTAFLFQKTTGKDSLGGGDIKLIAAIGAFLGVWGTLFTVLFASLIALVILIILRHDNKKPFPFGPFLISGAITYILAGNTLIELYLRLYNIY
ncbi:MAG: prepilin peptidase [Candidatus Cloacimonetes bacterium]|nr:prepilin peptidase [Candidatus Cloacimonadota bacterium]